MANPSWWVPWSYGGYNLEEPSLNAYELLNWFLPAMAPYEQSLAAQSLYELGAQEVLPQALPGYARPIGTPGTTADWLSRVSGVRNAPTPDWFAGSPEANWLQSLHSAASGLRPDMTRSQQRLWRQGYEDVMARAPNQEMAALGSFLYNPTLQAPRFGQAAPLGTYLQDYQVRGGLVANPWYT